jgi:hypothetical protein
VCRSGQLSNKTQSYPLTGNLCTKYLKKNLTPYQTCVQGFYRIRQRLTQEYVPQCGMALADEQGNVD